MFVYSKSNFAFRILTIVIFISMFYEENNLRKPRKFGRYSLIYPFIRRIITSVVYINSSRHLHCRDQSLSNQIRASQSPDRNPRSVDLYRIYQFLSLQFPQPNDNTSSSPTNTFFHTI